MAGRGRNIFERAWDAISMRPQTPEPPPQERAVAAPTQVDRTPRNRYRVEQGRITQERANRLDALTATVPRENLDQLTAAETKEYLEAHMRSLTQMRDMERQVIEQRYGRGVVGRFNEWLHETDVGRVVKIGGKIVGGVGVAAAAGIMTGGAGLLLAPLATMMGRKYAVSGLVEAAQWLWPARGERTRRLNLEASRADRATLETQAQNLRTEFDAGRLTGDQLRVGVLTVMQQIRDNENRILQQDREYEEVRTNNMRVRGYVSTGASLVMGLTMGINFGIQDLDHNGIAHSVKAYGDGIFWHQNQQSLAFGNWWETIGQRMAHVATGEYGPLAGAPGDLVRAGGEFAARAAAGGNVSMGAFMPDQLARMLGGLGIAGVGMIGATLREAGSFAGGSRREIQRLLRENIRVEDGDMSQFRGAGRPTTGTERARATTTSAERARPTTTTERARRTTTTERPPEEQTETRPTTTNEQGSRRTTTTERPPVEMTGQVRPTTSNESISQGPVERRATTSNERPTTTAVGSETSPIESRLATRFRSIPIEMFFQNGNTLFRREVMRTMQGASANESVDVSEEAVQRWIGGLDQRGCRRVRDYLARQEASAVRNQAGYTGDGRRDLYERNRRTLTQLREQIEQREQNFTAAA